MNISDAEMRNLTDYLLHDVHATTADLDMDNLFFRVTKCVRIEMLNIADQAGDDVKFKGSHKQHYEDLAEYSTRLGTEWICR